MREHCNDGAERIASALRNRYGVNHSPHAVECHASRLGITLTAYEVCPECGRRAAALSVDGVCPVCHKRMLADRARERNRRLAEEVRGLTESDAYVAARRDYDKERQRTAQLRRKLRGNTVEVEK